MNQLIRSQAARMAGPVEAGDVFATLAPGIRFPDLSTVPTADINFGPYFSARWLHPSSATHRVIANAMIARSTSSMPPDPAAALGCASHCEV
jgi:hypothetical protein